MVYFLTGLATPPGTGAVLFLLVPRTSSGCQRSLAIPCSLVPHFATDPHTFWDFGSLFITLRRHSGQLLRQRRSRPLQTLRRFLRCWTGHSPESLVRWSLCHTCPAPPAHLASSAGTSRLHVTSRAREPLSSSFLLGVSSSVRVFSFISLSAYLALGIRATPSAFARFGSRLLSTRTSW